MYLKSIIVHGLNGRDTSLSAQFNRDLNVVTGRNGAGKTTLINIIAGFKTPDSGRVTVLNRGLQSNASKNICYLTHELQVSFNCSVREFLAFNAFFL